MKRIIILIMVLLLLLAGCGSRKAYELQYESPYLSVTHTAEGEACFHAQDGALGEDAEKHVSLDVSSVKDVAVKTYGVSKVVIDFAGEKKPLQTALKEGMITPQQLVMRARIDAAAGLCDMQQYNDGGTTVYIYEDYRLYKIKQFTASGTVDGDVWITAPDVELNKLK